MDRRLYKKIVVLLKRTKTICVQLTTVETGYNAVLRVHRSVSRYIQVDRYNAVFPPRHHEWLLSAVDCLIL